MYIIRGEWLVSCHNFDSFCFVCVLTSLALVASTTHCVHNGNAVIRAQCA